MSAPTPITDHTAATVMSTAQPTHGTAGPWYMYWVNPATMAPIQNPFLSLHYWDYHNATGSSNDSGCNFNAMDQESVDEDMRLKAMEEKWTQLMAEANEDMTEEEILQNLDQRLTAMEEMWAQLTADAEDEVTDEETLQTLDERLAAMEEHLMQMIARAQAHN
ncbi:uncharacterized protein C8Q71DRAFT_723198 [Rhodofomes roseus]|uniref:Uncharacterized protein n=1 Tax=Rhodofomes roseus TaxID=34475 RepID=A0ABQ8KJ06_9APHY|nr:uncharacterized protein C8Q71DRAFT_723198 [Rhodofomes roseus]KAH9837949.1 hypothetical protein C8Q71DRAFT_723198 [Rhodofomes roseus]